MSYKFTDNDSTDNDSFTISGIYTIINRKTKTFYIGESMDIKRRRKEHFDMLHNGNHYNSQMQKDYHQYGLDSFDFKIIQPHLSYNSMRTKAELIILENAYIKYYSKKYHLYNIEDTMHNILFDNKKVYYDTPYSAEAIKRYIVYILSNHNAELFDNIFIITRVPTLNDITERKNKESKNVTSKIKLLVDSSPNNSLTKRDINYIQYGDLITKTTYIINDFEQYKKWLIENNHESYIRAINNNLNNDINKILL